MQRTTAKPLSSIVADRRTEPREGPGALASALRPPATGGDRRQNDHRAQPERSERPLCRSVFISDVHLGARNSRPDLLLDFLDAHPAETIYLVGDITDNWIRLGRSWRPMHHELLLRFLDLARSGTRIVYTPGNHDAFFAQYAGLSVAGVTVAPEWVHETPDGRRLLVTHGDCCDVFARKAPVLARVGSLLEGAARLADEGQRMLARRLGAQSEWTGIDDAIARINAEIRKHDRFEERLVNMARRRGFDGVVCGHFHQPALYESEGVTYANCGDWTGSNTAIAEDFDGALRLYTWDAAAAEATASEDAFFGLTYTLGHG